jgi:hypothetical protein
MANALAIALHALATEVASGTSPTTPVGYVDIGTATYPSLRSAAALELDVVALASGGRLDVEIQTSSTGTSDWKHRHTETVTEVTEEPRKLYVGMLERFVRASWTLTGASARFSLAGKAHTLFCTPWTITSDAVPGFALSSVSEEQKLRACIVGSVEAEGYLASAYETPILAWGADVEEKTALLCAAKLFSHRGRDPEGPDKGVFDAAAEAVTWFNRIANGKLKPPGIVDSTPEVFEGGSVVVSKPSRGW